MSASTVSRISVKTASTATNIASADFSVSSFIADSSSSPRVVNSKKVLNVQVFHHFSDVLTHGPHVHRQNQCP